jgi:hypothetical protein
MIFIRTLLIQLMSLSVFASPRQAGEAIPNTELEMRIIASVGAGFPAIPCLKEIFVR